ncbi:MAG: hypothetical protein ACFE95_01530 [Candidatus Hodarchaeota archaeon]
MNLLEIIKMYFDSSVNSRIELFQEITHPNFIRFGLGNSNELYYMSRDEVINQSLIGLSKARETIPNFKCSFKIKKITHLTIHDVIASIGVEWIMMMTDSVGIHCTCFHLAKDEGKWILVNALDRGKEGLIKIPESI